MLTEYYWRDRLSKEECDKLFLFPQWRDELKRLTKVSNSRLMKVNTEHAYALICMPRSCSH